jgi:aspartate carbamoyltransferase catalytic subunit
MRHLLSVEDLSNSEALELLTLANEMKKSNLKEVKRIPALSGRLIANLFFEDSTRTRLSFEIAAKRLSADVVNFTAKGSSMSKGESLKDTVLTLEAMGVESFIVRHSSSGTAKLIADAHWSKAAVINAGDGTHEHPTQALLDALTIRNALKGPGSDEDLTGVRVLIVGDVLHSRVARSNALLLRTLGATVAFCGPGTLLPEFSKRLANESYSDLDQALEAGFDIVMMLRIQQERMNSGFIPNNLEYAERFGLTKARFERLSKNTLVMHPGPMNRGLEISATAADSSQSLT